MVIISYHILATTFYFLKEMSRDLEHVRVLEERLRLGITSRLQVGHLGQVVIPAAGSLVLKVKLYQGGSG